MRAAALGLAASAMAFLALGCAHPPPREYVGPPPDMRAGMRPDMRTDTRAAVAISFAEAQLGKRYCWGGTGPNCFDCSGLVQSAWRAAGARLPRTTDAQARALVTVPLAEVRAGDIFWWSHGHVGLYLGDGTIIDAYHSGAGVVRRRAPRPERVLRVQGL